MPIHSGALDRIQVRTDLDLPPYAGFELHHRRVWGIGGPNFNQALQCAGWVAGFLEIGELICRDSLHREESRGGHLREEHQTPGGEARRDDEHFAWVPAGEYNCATPPTLRKERPEFETVKPSTHSDE